MGLSLDALSDVDAAFRVPSVALMAVSCGILLAGYGISAALWGRMVLDLGGPALPLGAAVRVYMVANLGRYVPGKVWQIAGLAMLGRQVGVPPPVAAGAAVAGQGISLVAATLVGFGTLFGGSGPLAGWGGWVGGALAAALVLVLAAPKVFRAFVGTFFRLARREPPEELSGVHAFRWLVAFVLNWVVYGLAFQFFVASFGFGGPVLPVVAAFPAAYVLGYLMIFAPAGIGVREGFLVIFLAPYMGVGEAGVLAALARVWTTAVEVVPAAVLWIRTPGGRGPEESPGA